MRLNTTKGHTVKLENLFLGYPGLLTANRQAIFGPVNLDIRHAEMVGIIGRNGIGKSTLLRTITGLQDQVDGKVYFDGIENSRIAQKELARLVSFVSTENISIQHLRVIDLVALGRFPYTGWFGKLSSFDHNIVNEAIERTGLRHFTHKPLHQLSDGERQKVMIARALAQDTPVIILDEPTAFLDLPSRHEILRLLNDLSRNNNKTIIFSTHDLAIAMDEADRLCLMTDQGFFEGAPEDLLINQVFRKLFLNSPVEFDAKTSAFRFKRELTRTATIQGEKKYCSVTRKAMERIGFLTVEEDVTDVSISVTIINEQLCWQLACRDTFISFNSIYALTSFLKKEYAHDNS